ncbi:hypothetical protein VSDG_00469 [Cytospora chrysosperma]|uniref:Chemoreceptor glutamine deamidase CheD n=1 Tax=Cytospora chrysosperma TaxID=252740 RepID=A0A423WQB1_CYTCH|nr:hypothetical protein VSDG_00469 [Valsa sordida]
MAPIIVEMDQFASGADKDILATHGLACCIGVAIVGTYPRLPLRGTKPQSKFLAHLADGPDFNKIWEAMQHHVLQAKTQGLRNIRAKVVVVDTATLKDDKCMKWSSHAISSQLEQNRAIIKRVDRLVGGNVKVVQHDINDEQDLRITPDNQILVTSI